MTNLQILADEQSELLVGGFLDITTVTRKVKNDVKTFTATARVSTFQQNLATTSGLGLGFAAVGAASSEQANLSTVGISQPVG